jgi:hypothetical protein
MVQCDNRISFYDSQAGFKAGYWRQIFKELNLFGRMAGLPARSNSYLQV